MRVCNQGSLTPRVTPLNKASTLLCYVIGKAKIIKLNYFVDTCGDKKKSF